MTKRRRQGMAGSILEQFAELKSDYEIAKTSRYKRTKTGIMTLGSHAKSVIGDRSQEGQRLKTLCPTRPSAASPGIQNTEQEETERTEWRFPLSVLSVTSCSKFEPWRSVTRVNDTTQINARDEAGHRQVFHHFLPDRRSQTRGVTAFAPMADTADHWDDLQFDNLVAAKIQSCYTILREMDAGAPTLPVAGGGDRGETTEIRRDGETRTLTDAVPAFEICGYKGKQVRGFVPTLPGLQFFDHSNMLLGILWLYDRRTGYTCLRQQRRRAASVVPRFERT